MRRSAGGLWGGELSANEATAARAPPDPLLIFRWKKDRVGSGWRAVETVRKFPERQRNPGQIPQSAAAVCAPLMPQSSLQVSRHRGTLWETVRGTLQSVQGGRCSLL
jgi:hypothetical protein